MYEKRLNAHTDDIKNVVTKLAKYFNNFLMLRKNSSKLTANKLI